MVSRISKFLAVFIVVGLALYAVLLNRETITLHLSPSTQISTNAGVIYIGIFSLGIIFTALVALVFGIRSHFRERRLQHKDRQRQEFYQGMMRARGFLASGEWGKAAEQWQQIVKKDPTDVIARIELSRCLQGAGEVREALKVLDAARSVAPDNTEVLFRAAEINLGLHNKTAAIDNLALILFNQPNRKAAQMARDLSEELERYADALEYQARLETFGVDEEEARRDRARLELKKILFDGRTDPLAFEPNLRALVKKYGDFGPPLRRLAQLEVERGNIEEAAQLYVKAAKADSSPELWLEASKLWLAQQQPDRAIAAARAATRDTRGKLRLRAELQLISLQLSLNMVDEARKSLDGFPALAKSEGTVPDQELEHDYLILRGLCLNRMGEYQKSAEIWQRLCECDFDIRSAVLRSSQSPGNGSAPSPSLSTP